MADFDKFNTETEGLSEKKVYIDVDDNGVISGLF